MSINSFDTNIAKAVGISAAVIYQNIFFWCEKNKANKKNIHDGKIWTYNSTRAFSEQFSYLTDKQIRTSLAKLESAGLISTGNFNKSAYDRTKWYSCIELNEEIHLPNESNEFDSMGEPIPDSNPDINPLTHTCALQAPAQKKVPYDEILNLYHKILPSLPRVKIKTEARIKSMKARHITNLNSNLENWEGYFTHIRDNCTWMLSGQYSIDFDYIITLKNYVKILEGTKNDR